MRPGSSRQSHHAAGSSSTASNTGSRRTPTRSMDPPPPPPRTEAQRKKAEASFGTRRPNFAQTMADEPPATSSSYTTRRTNVFSQAAEAAKQQNTTESDYMDPLSKQFQETFVDGRQRTPYSAHTGEKFNPLDGTNLARGRTVRDNLRNEPVSGSRSQPPSPPSRRRSASVPDEADAKTSPGRSRAGHRYTPAEPASSGSSLFPEQGHSTRKY
jgi:hypothetical protein